MNTKRCKPVDQDGCSQRKPMDQFPERLSKPRVDGSQIKLHGNWCLECQRKRDNARAARKRAGKPPGIGNVGCGRKREIHHTGPKEGTPEHAFFCR